jgi:VWFA-related protein
VKVVTLSAFTFALLAQDSQFESRSRLVLVPVTVTDKQGRTVDGLEAADFTVLDNGRAQRITVDGIDTGVAPVALTIAVQSSGISAAVLDKVRKIGNMIGPLVTGERGCAGVVSFAERVTWLQECTADADALNQALRKLVPGDKKAGRMLDAVNSAIDHLGRVPNSRRVMLLISESKDRGSESKLADVAQAAQVAGVTVYAATYSAFTTPFTSKAPSTVPGMHDPISVVPNPQKTVDGLPAQLPDPRLISPQNSVDMIGTFEELARLGKTDTTQALTAGTGGIKLSFTRQRGLEEAIQKLGAELNSQYVISFAPNTPDPGYHKLEVRVMRDSELRIRARPGYWTSTNAK